MNKLSQTRNINYSGRDFDSFRTNLQEYIKQYFPNTFSDFNQASSLMALTEANAYIGDVLSFYLDNRFNALFYNNSTDLNIIYQWAKNFSYKPKGITPSWSNIDLSITIATPSLSSNLFFVLQKGTQFLSDTDPQITFELRDNVDFSSTSDRTLLTTTDGLVVTKKGTVVAGETRTETFSVTTPDPFYKYLINDTDITEILSLTSSDYNNWYEVDTLAQDFILTGIRNPETSSSSVPYLLTTLSTERRFEVVKTASGNVYLQFGNSYISNENILKIPNPSDFVQNNVYRGQNENFVLKPASLETYLNTSSLGALPTNTSLTVTYRTGGGTDSNVPASTITSVRNRIDIPNDANYVLANTRTYQTVLQSLEVNNPETAQGGEDSEDATSIKKNIQLQNYAQQRLISERDYEFFSKQLPPAYGTVFRSKAKYNRDNSKIEFYVLSKTSSDTLEIAHQFLRDNLVNYFSFIKPLDDNIVIYNGSIINIGISYSISIDKSYNQSQVIVNTINELQRFLSIYNFDMGEPISKTEVVQQIQQLDGVLSIGSFDIFNINGTTNGRTYSDYVFDVPQNTKNEFIYPGYNSQFEIKYPQYDIIVQVI